MAIIVPRRDDMMLEGDLVSQRWITFFELLTQTINDGSDGGSTIIEGDENISFAVGRFASNAEVQQLAKMFSDEIKATILSQTRGFIRPTGQWDTNRIYDIGDEALDSGWLGNCIATTQDRLAPQPTGTPEFTLPDAPAFLTQGNASVVWSGQRYVFNQTGWVQRLRVWIPNLSATTNYRFIIVDDSDPNNRVVSFIEEGVLSVGQWVTIGLGKKIVRPGSIFTILIDALDSGSNTVVTGGWTFTGETNNTGDPGLESWNKRKNEAETRINKQDLNGTDRTSELLSVIPGSTIQLTQTNDVSRFWTLDVDGANIDEGTYVRYDTSQADSGNAIQTGETTTIDITIPIPAATDYVEILNYWGANQPTWATVTGSLWYDGVEQAGSDTNAYGVDVEFQPATISPDWQLKAYTDL